MRAPGFADAVISDGMMFVSWSDNSDAEDGFAIEYSYETEWAASDAFDSVPAGATSKAIDVSDILDAGGIITSVTVKAANSVLSIASAGASTTPASLSATNFDVALARRLEVSELDDDYVFDAGATHGGETIVVENLGSNSVLSPGSYSLSTTGIVAIPIIERARLSIIRQQVLLANGDVTVFVEPPEKKSRFLPLPDSTDIPNGNLPRDRNGNVQYPLISGEDAGFLPPDIDHDGRVKVVTTQDITVTVGAPPNDVQVTIPAGSQITVDGPDNNHQFHIIQIKYPDPPQVA